MLLGCVLSLSGGSTSSMDVRSASVEGNWYGTSVTTDIGEVSAWVSCSGMRDVADTLILTFVGIGRTAIFYEESYQ